MLAWSGASSLVITCMWIFLTLILDRASITTVEKAGITTYAMVCTVSFMLAIWVSLSPDSCSLADLAWSSSLKPRLILISFQSSDISSAELVDNPLAEVVILSSSVYDATRSTRLRISVPKATGTRLAKAEVSSITRKIFSSW